MRGTSEFEVSLDVPNPIDFESDAFANALLLARDAYQGKCFLGRLLVRVVAVVRLGPCVLRLGAGVVDAVVRAEWLRYGQGDVLPAVRVVSRAELLVAEAVGLEGVPPFPVTLLNPNQVFAVGQLLPVRVVRVQYSPLALPSAVAELLTCRQGARVWRVAAARPDEPPPPPSLGEPLLAALAARAADPPGAPRRAFFAEMLHTFKGPPPPLALAQWPLDSAAAVAEWMQALAPGSRWVRPLELPFDWAGVAAAGVEEAGDEVVASAAAVAAAVLAEAANAAEAVNGLAALFPTTDSIASQKAVWRLMMGARRGAP